jgi:hypothetical protein
MKRYSMDGSCECGRYEDDRLYDDDNGDLVKYDDAAAEIEKLKCCGNCENVQKEYEDIICAIDNYYVDSFSGRCKFTPSRWKIHQQ